MQEPAPRYSAVAAALVGIALTGLFAASSRSQTGPVNGIRPAELRAHAITNAAVVVSPDQTIERATIVVRDGVIEAVGADVQPPAGARVWDATGLTVYPGLIEPSLFIDLAAIPRSEGSHWNTRVHPEVRMCEQPGPPANVREELRKLGYAAAAVYPSAGTFRGMGAVVSTDAAAEDVDCYRDETFMAAALEHGGGGGGGGRQGGSYPGSKAGAVALMRQTLYDAQWHARCEEVYAKHPDGNEPPLRADALAALRPVLDGRSKLLIEVDDVHDAIRAQRVCDEFGLKAAFIGSGGEYERLADVAALKSPVIVPVNYPERPKVESLNDAETLTLREMMLWEQAPANLARLVEAGVDVSITTEGLDNRSNVFENLRTAIKCGLSEADALALLTTRPAALLGLSDTLGTIEAGKIANFVITDKTLFDKKMQVRDTWVNGKRYEINKAPEKKLRAEGTLTTSTGRELPATIDAKKSSVTFTLPDEKKLKAKKVSVQADQISFVVDGKPFDAEGYVVFGGVMSSDGVTGSALLPSGERFEFSFAAVTMLPDEDDEDKDKDDKAKEGDEEKKEGEEEAAQTDQPVADADDNAEADKTDDGVSGAWTVMIEGPNMPQSFPLAIELKLEEGGRLTGNVQMMRDEVDISEGSYDPSSGAVALKFAGMRGSEVTLTGTISAGELKGSFESEMFSGSFSGSRGEGEAIAKKDEEERFEPPPSELVYPLGEYGLAQLPQQEDLLITNATIWTCGPQGVIENGWMIVRGGKVAAIGSSSSIPADAPSKTIDAQGKHVTPGLIDCHSHTGLTGGVNEFMQTNTAEVRMSDVIEPDDINWYRELAGGLTAANQLHGSANPIGGQNSVVKLKWGGNADDFSIDGAFPGIKFALGENVKRSAGRYPDTRMGVETFIRDAFTAARDYRDAWDRYESLPTQEREKAYPPRRDLELDTLVEILDRQRIVHCHSYRQDEILMLIRIADEFGFQIGTFQHVLEGYKVADAIAAHGAGGSSFSDWWMYKVEVMDAIPHNGSLMTNVGVLMSFNSDSDELARRMNTEASKAVRFGGLSEESALKLVTINPAKQLRIDERTGSLETGKDADFVIWSGHPLSAYTRCEQTWIEGACHFNLEKDAELRAWTNNERQRLIQKILIAQHGELKSDDAGNAGVGEGGGPPGAGEGGGMRRGRRGGSRPGEDWMYAQLPDELIDALVDRVRKGEDPMEIRPGDCGCGGIEELLEHYRSGQHSHGGAR